MYALILGEFAPYCGNFQSILYLDSFSSGDLEDGTMSWKIAYERLEDEEERYGEVARVSGSSLGMEDGVLLTYIL